MHRTAELAEQVIASEGAPAAGAAVLAEVPKPPWLRKMAAPTTMFTAVFVAVTDAATLTLPAIGAVDPSTEQYDESAVFCRCVQVSEDPVIDPGGVRFSSDAETAAAKSPPSAATPAATRGLAPVSAACLP